MNKKITVKNAFGKTVYCVLSGDHPFKEQIAKVLLLSSGQGFTVEINEKQIIVKDYFHAESVGSFDIISITDTDQNADLNWMPL